MQCLRSGGRKSKVRVAAGLLLLKTSGRVCSDLAPRLLDSQLHTHTVSLSPFCPFTRTLVTLAEGPPL